MKIKSFDQIFKMLPMKQQDMLKSLEQIRERPDHHPESNALIHVKIVTERCIQTGDIDLVLAAIFHDIFKFKLNQINEKTGWPTARDHEKEAAMMVIDESDLIKSFGADPGTVAGICLHHMRIKNFSEMKKSKREHMKAQPFFNKLIVFALADDMLREGPMPKMKGLFQHKIEFDEKIGKAIILNKYLKLF